MKVPHILLRSSWQTVNIGDIGHTPGILRLFERHLPEARITLLPNKIDRGVRDLLLHHWPLLQIAEGDIDSSGNPTTPEVARAFEECDILVHSSGPQLMSPHIIDAWRRTGKPYGFCGITIDPFAFGTGGDWEGGTLDQLQSRIQALPIGFMAPPERELLSASSFLFLRDTLSLEHVRRQIPGLGHAAFGPDAAFACDLCDDANAGKLLVRHGLEPHKFICVVPRLRWTPYHQIHQLSANDATRAKDAVNGRTRSSDHQALREMIVQWVRHTGLKVLTCPEMTYEVELAREELVDPLPDDVKKNVVWKDSYWLNDEATSIYREACAVISLENHSPILALAQGTPSIFLRQPTDTIKGQMWVDLGLGPDFHEIESVTGDKLWERLSLIHDNPGAARQRVQELRNRVDALHRSMMQAIRRIHI